MKIEKGTIFELGQLISEAIPDDIRKRRLRVKRQIQKCREQMVTDDYDQITSHYWNSIMFEEIKKYETELKELNKKLDNEL